MGHLAAAQRCKEYIVRACVRAGSRLPGGAGSASSTSVGLAKKHAKPLRASLMMFLVSVATSGPVPSPGATGSDGGMPCTHACSKYTANQVCVCPVDLHCVLGDQA